MEFSNVKKQLSSETNPAWKTWCTNFLGNRGWVLGVKLIEIYSNLFSIGGCLGFRAYVGDKNLPSCTGIIS